MGEFYEFPFDDVDLDWYNKTEKMISGLPRGSIYLEQYPCDGGRRPWFVYLVGIKGSMCECNILERARDMARCIRDKSVYLLAQEQRRLQTIMVEPKPELTFKVNEIFEAPQGEGDQVGRFMTFVRVAKCNLHCDFCDTEFNTFTEYTLAQMVDKLEELGNHYVVFTGGEPTLQRRFIYKLVKASPKYCYHMETNGLIDIPRALAGYFDHIVCAPKGPMENIKMHKITCLKFLISGEVNLLHYYPDGESINKIILNLCKRFNSPYLFVSPINVSGDHVAYSFGDTPEKIMKSKLALNTCIEFIKAFPEFRLSVQVHKYIGVK